MTGDPADLPEQSGDVAEGAGGGERPPDIRFESNAGRWVVLATVLGSGMVFLDGTVVNVALPSISTDLGASFADLQWTINGYMVTLTALLLLGGSLGDMLGRRRVFVWGLAGFTAASVICGLAPTTTVLIIARAAQGVGGALLVPGSLAIMGSVFHPDDRGRAIGAWSGLAGVTTSIGPFLGGWLIDVGSWRSIFFINVPLAALAIWIAVRHVPDTRSPRPGRLDLSGAAAATVGLAGVSYAAIQHSGTDSVVAGIVGAGALILFVAIQRLSRAPMMPLWLFRSTQFSGTNMTTLAVYAALAAAMFMVTLRLQVSMGYTALAAGAALVPFSVVMLLFSARAGQLGQRVGPRTPLTVGPLIAAAGLLWLADLGPGDSYWTSAFPAVCIFGAGMTVLVAPLTTAVLGSVDDSMSGIASGINNAVSRLAGLLAVAVIPGIAGIATDASLKADLESGYGSAVRISALLMAMGAVVAVSFVRSNPTPLQQTD